MRLSVTYAPVWLDHEAFFGNWATAAFVANLGSTWLDAKSKLTALFLAKKNSGVALEEEPWSPEIEDSKVLSYTQE